MKAAADDLALISGQKPIVTRARVSIANFKIRRGMGIGVKVTLRRNHMYEFIDRLVTVALPRVRDFRGLSGKSFDGHGNFAIGIKEHIIFPEIDYDKTEASWGMDVVICTSAQERRGGQGFAQGIQFSVRHLTAACRRNIWPRRVLWNATRSGGSSSSVMPQSARSSRRSQTTSALTPEERFAARLKLAELPRNSSPTRIHNRCEITGRSRGYYRKVRMSRIALRELAAAGQVPGMTKASW